MRLDRYRSWRPALYVVLIPACVVLYGMVNWSLSPYAFLRALVIALVLGVALGLIGHALAGDRDRGGLIAIAVVLAIVAGEHLLVLALAILIIVLVMLLRGESFDASRRLRWPLVTRAMNMVAVVLLLAMVVKGAQEGRVSEITYDVWADAPISIRTEAAIAATSGSPDIYLILLDGYLRPDKQLELMGVDQSAFVHGLEGRGFDVLAGSRSNYLLTKLSLTSMLNMRHIDDISDEAGHTAASPKLGVQRYLLNRSAAFDIARAAGYETIALSSGFEELAMRQADRFLDTVQPSDVEYTLLGSTAILSLLEVVDPGWAVDQHRARVEDLFEMIGAVAAEPSERPRFVVAHIPSPHVPIVFGAEGERLAPLDPDWLYREHPPAERGGPTDYAAAYGAQATYIGKRTLEVIDRILSASATPPVIVVFADHGSGLGWSSDDMAGSDLDQRTAVLTAVVTPGHPGLLPEDTTLVNVLGPIFNTYLGTTVPAQEDASFVWLPGPPTEVRRIDLPDARTDDDG